MNIILNLVIMMDHLGNLRLIAKKFSSDRLLAILPPPSMM